MKSGDKIVLVHTADPYTDLQAGATGTVQRVSTDHWGKRIDVRWDNGSGLAMLPDAGDVVKVVA